MDIKVSSRQKEIVDSARRIIIKKGMECLTVREIARDLKITDGALYRHFKSKKAIVALLIDDIEETLLNTIKRAANKHADPLLKLKAVFLSHLSYVEQRRGVSFVIINEVLSIKDKGLQKKMFKVLNAYLKMINDILTEGIKSGKFRKRLSVEASSIMFFGSIQSLVTFWSLSGHRVSLSKHRAEQIFDIFKNCIILGRVSR